MTQTDLSTTLQTLRTQLGWTQQRLATEVGVPLRTLARWEAGETRPRSQEHIAAIRGVLIRYLRESAVQKVLGGGDSGGSVSTERIRPTTLTEIALPYLKKVTRPSLALNSVDIMEAHHAHLFAMEMEVLGYEAVVEVYYDRPWIEEGRKRWARGDIWAPPRTEPNEEHQTFMEVKRAWLHDTTSNRLGEGRYGLYRAAIDWAADFWRLLALPEGPTHCVFSLILMGPGKQTPFTSAPPQEEGVPTRAEVHADDVYRDICNLGSRKTSIEAVERLMVLSQETLGARVELVVPKVGGSPWINHLVIEWVQNQPAEADGPIPYIPEDE